MALFISDTVLHIGLFKPLVSTGGFLILQKINLIILKKVCKIFCNYKN